MCALQFHFQSDCQRLFHERQGLGFRRVNVFHEQLAAINSSSKRCHARRKHIPRAEFVHRNNGVSTYHVGDQTADLLVVSNVIAQQLGVGLRQLGGAHPHVLLVKLTRIKKFPCRRGRELEPLRRFDLVQFLQDSIAVRPLWLIEDIETAEPCCQRETGQKQNRDSPGKIVGSLPSTRVWFVLVRIVRMSAIVHQFSARRFRIST